jgi:hypothetical protein
MRNPQQLQIFPIDLTFAKSELGGVAFWCHPMQLKD